MAKTIISEHEMIWAWNSGRKSAGGVLPSFKESYKERRAREEENKLHLFIKKKQRTEGSLRIDPSWPQSVQMFLSFRKQQYFFYWC